MNIMMWSLKKCHCGREQNEASRLSTHHGEAMTTCCARKREVMIKIVYNISRKRVNVNLNELEMLMLTKSMLDVIISLESRRASCLTFLRHRILLSRLFGKINLKSVMIKINRLGK